jgi:hypothetical protein
MNRKKKKLIAKLLIATIGSNIELPAFGECNLTLEEETEILDEIAIICTKMVGEHPINFGDTTQIVDYVKELK